MSLPAISRFGDRFIYNERSWKVMRWDAHSDIYVCVPANTDILWLTSQEAQHLDVHRVTR